MCLPFIIRLKGAGQNTFDDLLYLEESNFKGTKNPLILTRTFSYDAERDTGSPRSQHLEKLLISTIYLHLFPFPLSFCLSLSWSTFLSRLLPVPFSHMHMNNSTILSRMQDDSQMMQLLLFCHMSFSSCVHSFSFLSVLSR